MTSPSASQNRYPYQNEPNWSGSEKIIARTAFDAALGRELHEVMQRAKQMANEIRQPSDLWELENYLTQRRKEIDRKYDFRSSRRIQVLGRLLCECQLNQEDLRGLEENKLNSVRSITTFLAQDKAA